MTRRYAKVVGTVVTVSGVAGVLGFGSTGLVTDYFHLLVGAFLIHAGSGGGCERSTRALVGGLGVICLPVSLLGLASHAAFGDLETEGGEPVFVVGSVVGALCLAAW